MVEILADIRERVSGIAARLRSLGWVVHERKLDTADYLIGSSVGIERKTATDFATSITHGRLFRQLVMLKESVQKPLVIIEGDRNQISGLHPNAVHGALVSISVRWYIPILWSRDSAQTAEYTAPR